MSRQAQTLAMALLVAGLCPTSKLTAQQATGAMRASAVLSADTVRVGEPFTLGIIISSDEPVRMPQLLPSGDGWEQLEVARIQTADSEVRAYYPLIAWQTDPIQLPDLTVSTGSDGDREFSVRLPIPVISSVLPSAEESPLLQPPRPPLDAGFPWGLLLAALILAALCLWWLAHRTTSAAAGEAPPADVPDARSQARDALLALRGDAEAGTVPAAGFYDRLEEILRRYLAGTRGWPASRPVRASRELATTDMGVVHRQALLARFAAVAWPSRRLVSDADSSLEWLGEHAE
jgi:hypothetical protein